MAYRFGKRMRQLRREAGVTGVELCQRIGVAEKMVSVWERHAPPPTPQRIIQICEALGIEDHQPELLKLAIQARGQIEIDFDELPEDVGDILAELALRASENRLSKKQVAAIAAILG